MSKNFELMQSLGVEIQGIPGPSVSAERPRVSSARASEKEKSRTLSLDRRARQEALSLVQRVFLLPTDPAKSVVFAGVDHSNGCTHVCAQAAEALAENVAGTVCLVEANMRSPSLPDVFGVRNHRGLTDALVTEGAIRDFAKQLYRKNLWLISCGVLSADSPHLLNSERLQARLAELRKEFDYVLVDAPPLSQYSDAVSLARSVDGMVLVLEANSTRREAARRIAENLRGAHIQVLAAVLNKRTFPIPEALYRRL